MKTIILAGGNGSRLGKEEKLLITINGKTLIDRVIHSVSSLINQKEILVVTSCPSSQKQISNIITKDIKIITDAYPGTGPLGGILTGLMTSDSFHNLILASDMPFVNQNLLRYMMSLSSENDAVVPSLGEKKLLEPLHAIYSKKCIPHVKNQIKKGNLKIGDFIRKIKKVRYVNENEINRFDPKHLSFFNINTKEDLKKKPKL